MANEDFNQRENVYSSKVRAGKRRTYFFDVRKTKGEDYYITITESTKKFNDDGYERHKIFLYKEDFNRFLNSLNDTVDHVKTELMPDFDYEIYERRQKEWEESIAKENAENAASESSPSEPTAEATETAETAETAETTESTESKSDAPSTEDADEDLSW